MGGEILVAEGRDTAGLDRGIGGVGSRGAGRLEGDGGAGWVGKGEVCRFFYGESVWGPQDTSKCLYYGKIFKCSKC